MPISIHSLYRCLGRTFVKKIVAAVSMSFSVVQIQAITIDSGTVETIPGTQTSPWELSDYLYINGSMNISNGGLVSNTQDGYVGNVSGSSGIVTVDGAGSSWTNSDSLHVGRNGGSGEMVISNGGSVSDKYGYIGTYAGSAGSVTVDGSDSSWNHSLSFFIGYGGGSGELSILNGGTVNNLHAYIGDSSSSGVATVDGLGSSWVNRGDLSVSGKLSISNGGFVSSGFSLIGTSSNLEAGSVTVDGIGSSWVTDGTLEVGLGEGALSIRNGGSVKAVNSYIGVSSGSSGIVTVDGTGSSLISDELSAGFFGGTGELNIQNNGLVHVANTATVTMGNDAVGTFNITSGGTLETQALSAGFGTSASVIFNDGTLRALANNNAFISGFTTGEFVIDSGSLTIDDNGYEIATDSSSFSGSGSLIKDGSGTLTLNGANTYTGSTTVASGTLKTGIENALSAESTFTLAAGSTLDLDGYAQTVANLNNTGTVRISSADTNSMLGTTLTVSGNYKSDGGSLYLSTVLGDDTSITDRLVADTVTTEGGRATRIYVKNAGGLGAQTSKGIEVVSVSGTSSTDAFTLGQAVTAGAYEYMLAKGSANQNWYLSSYLLDTNEREGKKQYYNPSTGAYLANQSAASGLFMHTLYDRQGHANNIAGGSAEKSSVWVRAATSHSRNQSVNGMMGTKTDASLIHLGGDVAKWQNEDGNLHLGLMGAYGQTDSDVTSQATHTTANGKVTGYALGVYGTWFADEAQGKGLYVDGWAQYGWYKNKVSGQAQVNDEEKYDSTNWTTSIEAGYGMHLYREDNTDLMFTPQVQITYNNYSADDHKDGNNLNVSGSDASGVITRVGARLHGKAVEGYGARPFMEANWIHNTAKNELNFNGEVLKDQMPEDKGELKLGLQGTIAKNWKVWGQVGGQWGSENYERYEGQVGVNYQW